MYIGLNTALRKLNFNHIWIRFQNYGEKVTAQYRELNLLMGEGWFGANLSFFFAVRENFLIFNCKSLAVLFCSMPRCHMKDLGTTGLTL